MIASALARTDWTPPWPARLAGTRDDLARYFAEAGFTTGVEIGTLRGEFAETLCRANPRLHLIAVDPWVSYPGYYDQLEVTRAKLPELYNVAQERLAGYSCDLWKMTSAEAAPLIPDESLDFVFIDGNHGYDYVLEDHHLWTPKVRRGGIVSGHDYHRFKRPPYRAIKVIEAVNDFTAAQRIGPWWLLDEGSYFWMKA